MFIVRDMDASMCYVRNLHGGRRGAGSLVGVLVLALVPALCIISTCAVHAAHVAHPNVCSCFNENQGAN
jgi:hypothetical protein